MQESQLFVQEENRQLLNDDHRLRIPTGCVDDCVNQSKKIDQICKLLGKFTPLWNNHFTLLCCAVCDKIKAFDTMDNSELYLICRDALRTSARIFLWDL